MTLVRAKHSLSPAKRSVTAEIGSSRAGRWDWPQVRLAQASPSLTDRKQGVEKHRTPNTEHRTLKRRASNIERRRPSIRFNDVVQVQNIGNTFGWCGGVKPRHTVEEKVNLWESE